MASAIFAGVSMVTFATISQVAAFQYKAVESRQTAQEAREIADMITRAVREAKGDTKLVIDPSIATYSSGVMMFSCASSVCVRINSDSPREGGANTLVTFSKDNYRIFVISNGAMYYSSGSNTGDINNAVVGTQLNTTITAILADSSKIISKASHSVAGGFNGYTPRDESANKQQPFIDFSIISETKDYNSVSANQRARSTIQSTVTSRNYDKVNSSL